MDKEGNERFVSMIYNKMKRNPFILRELFFIIFMIVVLSSCQKEEITKDLSPEEVARLVIKYRRSFNEKGLKKLLCKNCSTQPYNRVHIRKREFAYALEKQNVDLYDPNSQDFRDIKCLVLSRNEVAVNLKCEGKIVLYARDRSIVQVTYVNREVTLYFEGDRLTICPPVCLQ
jgi:hypothetical protein